MTGEIIATATGAVWGRKPITLTWHPHTDITVFELAQAVPLFTTPSALVRETFEALPASVKRHFEVGG